MNGQIPESVKVAPFLLFYLIHSMQIGVGILGFQRIVSMEAGYDGWISVLITGFAMFVITWIMLKLLTFAGQDMLEIHEFIIGRKISKVIGVLFILYFTLLTVSLLRNYIETIQVWMFPELRTYLFAFAFLLLTIYVIHGGVKTIAGISFFSVIIPSYVLPLFLFTLPFADFSNFTPVFDHSVKEIMNGSKQMSFTVIGFEILLFVYPFIKNQKKAKKWAYIAILVTTILYLYLVVLTYAYFPQEQLNKNIWPTLTMWKIIRLPFVERYEYIGVATWCLLVLPNVCIALWISSRLSKQVFRIRQSKALWIIVFVCLIATSLIDTREQINMITNITGKIGFYLNFVYIPLLFIAALIIRKVKERAKDS